MKNTEAYIKRLKELRVQIEKRAQEKTIENIYSDTFNLLKTNCWKRSLKRKILASFEKDFVKERKILSISI